MSRITHATYLNTTEDPSINTLHQSLEYHLQRLHNEKQEEISLNSQIKSLESKLQLSKQLLQRSVRPSDLSKSLSKLKKKVENTTSQVNLLHNENEQLKSKIDDLRQEGSTFRRVIGQLNENIKDSSFTAKTSSQQKLRVRSEEQSNKEKIHQLLNKSTTEKLDFSGKLEKITAGFMNFKKSQLESMKKHSEKLLKLVSRPFSAIDLIPILEKQLESRVMRTETMRKKLKSYKNNCKKIRNGLGKILSAVGRSDYIALAKQFIDSENQMKDVQVYIMNLSSEIDSLSVTNAVMFEGLKKTVTSKGSEIFLSLKKQVTSIKNRVDVLKFKSSVLNNSLLRVETIIDVFFN
jgi:chromosome segregation ATPase